MKKFYLLFLVLGLSQMTAKAQVTDLLTGLSLPYDAALYGNELYFTELGAGRIVKIDVTAAIPPPIVEVLTGLSNPAAMTIDGNFLYYGESGADRISKIDLTQPTPTPEVVLNTGLQTPNDLLVDGNFLYISDEGTDEIIRIDLTETSPTPEVIASGLTNPLGLAIFDNQLYFSIFGNGSVQKIDLNQDPIVISPLVSGLTLPAGITLDGGFLYIAENDKISRVDITATSPVAETVISNGINGSRNVSFNGVDLYLAQTGGTFGSTGLISKVTINTPVFATLPNVCMGDMPNMLGGASPSSGIYSGPGVTDNGDGSTFSFDPGAAGGAGTYTVTYILNGTTVASMITVLAAPNVTFSTGGLSVMEDAGLQTGLDGGMPAGGTYSGTGVTDDGNGMTYSFDPAAAGAGSAEVTYSFTDGNGCFGTASDNITVTTNLPGDECDDAIDLSALFAQAVNEAQTSDLYNNSGYTTSGSDPAVLDGCFFENDPYNGTSYYSFTGDGGSYRVRSVQCTGNNANLDLQVAIYSGDCGSLVDVACNEDEDGNNNLFNFNVEFDSEDGVDYTIIIDGYEGASGDFCIEVTNLGSVGVTNIMNTDLSVFPNPTTGWVQLPQIELDRIIVYDATGRVVLSQESPDSSIDLKGQSAGLYLMKLFAKDEVYSAKVIKD